MGRVRRPARVPAPAGAHVSVVLALAAVASLGVASGTAPAAAAAQPAAGWTVYHGDPLGTGVSSAAGPVGTSPAWTSPTLDGQLYGEPLASAGHVFVATENDTVVALDESTGRVAWTAHVGTPVPASSLPCGNIQPSVGITGTPVVDPVRDEVFVVADEEVGGRPTHELVGLDGRSGHVELAQPVDPPGQDPAALLQRSSLTLDGGRVVFGFGGNYGDCGPYHGWVISVPESGGPALRFELDAGAGQRLGAVWMGGAAPVVDAAGNVWVEVGNGSVTSPRGPYDDSDSVLELSPSLHLLQFFAPSSWAADNAADADLSTAPVLLGDGQVVAAGKSQVAYLLDGSRLGGIGGQETTLRTGCGDDIDGGAAVVGSTVYLPCLDGPIAVQVALSPPSLHELWRAPAGGGPPVVAGGLVWSIGQDGVLYGFDPATGAVRQRASVGAAANHFPTPGVGDGLLLAAAADQVRAFAYGQPATPSAPTAAASTTPTRRAAAGRGAPASPSGGLPPGAIAALAALGAVLLAAAGWALLRRRSRAGAAPR